MTWKRFLHPFVRKNTGDKWIPLTNHDPESSTMTDYRGKFLLSHQPRKINQFCWQNMSAYLKNKNCCWWKKLLTHLNWALYNACDLNIDHHVCFYPISSHHLDQSILLAQKPVTERSETPVCARTPYRSRNSYSGCLIIDLITSLNINKGNPRRLSFQVG